MQENFLFACLKWACDRGGITTSYSRFSPELVTLQYGTGRFRIVHWRHPSPRPTVADLRTYSASDLATTRSLYDAHVVLESGGCVVRPEKDFDLEDFRYAAHKGSLVCLFTDTERHTFCLDDGLRWFLVASRCTRKSLPGPTGPRGPTGVFQLK